ncbi:putative phosphatase family protein [Paratrimastix pyriformis]|uniref:Phosphatase family protein n=1 Tax=Paratrimastix pyriformis TaxID=342808 RepID=A0ABQ8UZL3_9EUKA|nr:putative phosphatase family protein [Paratrimastix pyriformis]
MSSFHDLQKMLMQRESEFIDRQDLSLCAVTWNVNNNKPPETLLPMIRAARTAVPLPHISNNVVAPPPPVSDAFDSSEAAGDDEGDDADVPESSSTAGGDLSHPALPAHVGLTAMGEGEEGPQVFPDLYAFGFQEIDLTASGLILSDTSKAAPWHQKIQAALDEDGEPYIHVFSKQMVGLLLCLFVKKRYASELTDLAWSTAGCGLMGTMGNKGGVAIRFRFRQTTFCIVCAHLCAQARNVARRNRDQSHVIWMGDFNYRLNMGCPEAVAQVEAEQWDTLLAHDQLCIEREKQTTFPSPSPSLFFALSRLLVGRPPLQLCIEREKQTTFPSPSPSLFFALSRLLVGRPPLQLCIEREKQTTFPSPSPSLFFALSRLLVGRPPLQLCIEREKQTTFPGCAEGPIRFAPTYKYRPHTASYHVSAEHPRTPSWCDRVLFRVPRRQLDRLQDPDRPACIQLRSLPPADAPAGTAGTPPVRGIYATVSGGPGEDSAPPTQLRDQILLRSYHRIDTSLMSDHRPVAALFDVPVWVVSAKRREAVYSSLIRDMDRLINDSIPTAAVSATQIEFGTVAYGSPVKRTLNVVNLGKVPARFQFSRPDADTPLPGWLVAHPTTGTLQPGESVDIVCTAIVRGPSELTADLNERQQALNCIVVFQIVDGRDHFVPRLITVTSTPGLTHTHTPPGCPTRADLHRRAPPPRPIQITFSGHYLPSCFGARLPFLLDLPRPIRSLESPSPVASATSPLLPPPATLSALLQPAQPQRTNSIPAELWRMAAFIFAHRGQLPAMRPLDMGDPTTLVTLAEIREALDTGTEFPLTATLPAMLQSIVVFFEALPRPLISREYHSLMTAAQRGSVSMKWSILNQMPVMVGTALTYCLVLLKHLPPCRQTLDFQTALCSAFFQSGGSLSPALAQFMADLIR